MEEAKTDHQEVETYELLKRRRGCTGMFWRSDPAGKTRVASNDNWPRDNAVLRGTVMRHKKQKWLHVTHVKQCYENDFTEAPQNAYIPFEYNNHYYLKAYKEEKKKEEPKQKSEPKKAENKTGGKSSPSGGLFGWIKRNKEPTGM